MNDYLPHAQGITGRSEGSGVNVRDTVFTFYRRRWIILAVAAPIMLVASLSLFNNVGTFVAGCRILLDLQAPEVPRWNTRAYVDYERSLSTYQHMAMSVPVARKASEALEDSLSVIRSLDEGAYAGISSGQDLAGFLLDGLDISPVGESSILAMRFGSPNPRLSLMAVEAMRDAFLDYSVRATKNNEAIQYYDEQVQTVRNEIDFLLVARAEVINKAGYSSIKDDLKYLSGQAANLRDLVFKELATMRYLRSLASSYRKARLEDPGFFPATDRERESSIMIAAKSQVEEVRQRLAEASLKYTEDHVEVIRARERLIEAERLLAREIDGYIRSVEIEADAAQEKAIVLQDQMHSLQGALALGPDLERRVGLIDTEVNALKELLEDLQIKRGEVQITERADERINMIIKLTEPEIVSVVTGSRRIVYFLIISVFGLIFAVIVAFVVDYQDHRIYAPDRLEQQLGVPVLGSVSQASRGPAET